MLSSSIDLWAWNGQLISQCEITTCGIKLSENSVWRLWLATESSPSYTEGRHSQFSKEGCCSIKDTCCGNEDMNAYISTYIWFHGKYRNKSLYSLSLMNDTHTRCNLSINKYHYHCPKPGNFFMSLNRKMCVPWHRAICVTWIWFVDILILCIVLENTTIKEYNECLVT